MKFFVDTADTAAIKELHEAGLVDGVTTNPSLIAKSGRDFKEVIKEIAPARSPQKLPALNMTAWSPKANTLQRLRKTSSSSCR
jgi:transaldolase